MDAIAPARLFIEAANENAAYSTQCRAFRVSRIYDEPEMMHVSTHRNSVEDAKRRLIGHFIAGGQHACSAHGSAQFIEVEGVRGRPVDYRCEAGGLPVFASCVIISNPQLFSSSESGVISGNTRLKKAPVRVSFMSESHL